MISRPSPPWCALNLIAGKHRRGVAEELELRQKRFPLCLLTGNGENEICLVSQSKCTVPLNRKTCSTSAAPLLITGFEVQRKVSFSVVSHTWFTLCLKWKHPTAFNHGTAFIISKLNVDNKRTQKNRGTFLKLVHCYGVHIDEIPSFSQTLTVSPSLAIPFLPRRPPSHVFACFLFGFSHVAFLTSSFHLFPKSLKSFICHCLICVCFFYP